MRSPPRITPEPRAAFSVKAIQGYLARTKLPSLLKTAVGAYAWSYCRVLWGGGFLSARYPCSQIQVFIFYELRGISGISLPKCLISSGRVCIIKTQA